MTQPAHAPLLLAPDLLGPPGGIARYGTLVGRALVATGHAPVALALNDAPGGAPGPWPGATYQACGGDRRAFAQGALVAALRGRPRVVLVGHSNFAPLGWAVARLVGARLVVFAYGGEVWGPLSRPRRLALQRADRVIAISHYTAGWVRAANGVGAARLRVLPNCLDPAFPAAAPAPKPAAPLSLLTVARLSLVEQYKGHDYVIRALPALLARFPGLVYDVVGTGDWQPTLAALARAEGVAAAVRFHGVVSEAALVHHYAAASLFIMPSRAEGFGFVFLEAMAQGTPAIGGNRDATPEVIVDGETGYLVDPTSVHAIVQAASRLLGDAGLRGRMGAAAARHVADGFSFARFARRLQGYLDELQPLGGHDA